MNRGLTTNSQKGNSFFGLSIVPIQKHPHMLSVVVCSGGIVNNNKEPLALASSHCIEDVKGVSSSLNFGITNENHSTILLHDLFYKDDVAFGRVESKLSLSKYPRLIDLDKIHSYVKQKKIVSFYGMGGSNQWFYLLIGEEVDYGRKDVGFFSLATPRKVKCSLRSLNNDGTLRIDCGSYHGYDGYIRNGDSGAIVTTEDNEVIGIISYIYDAGRQGVVSTVSL